MGLVQEAQRQEVLQQVLRLQVQEEGRSLQLLSQGQWGPRLRDTADNARAAPLVLPLLPHPCPPHSLLQKCVLAAAEAGLQTPAL